MLTRATGTYLYYPFTLWDEEWLKDQKPFLTGNLENWWNPDTETMFREKAQCMIDQYGSFVHPQVGLKLNGINTQGENIADNGGIKEAYYGYCKSTISIGLSICHQRALHKR